MALLLNKQEKDWIIENEHILTIEQIAEKYNTSRESIKDFFKSNGIKKTRITIVGWSDKEIEFLKRNINMNIDDLVIALKRSPRAINHQRKNLILRNLA